MILLKPGVCVCGFVTQVRQLERTVGLKDLTVAEMEGRLREMSATTFDGVFVWRISDFAKKRQDAIAGRAPAMFSPGNMRSDCSK